MNGHEAAVMTKGRSSKSRAPNPLRTARAVEKTPQRATHTFVLTLSDLEETQTSANISTHGRNVCAAQIYFQPPAGEYGKGDGDGVGSGE